MEPALLSILAFGLSSAAIGGIERRRGDAQAQRVEQLTRTNDELRDEVSALRSSEARIAPIMGLLADPCGCIAMRDEQPVLYAVVGVAAQVPPAQPVAARLSVGSAPEPTLLRLALAHPLSFDTPDLDERLRAIPTPRGRDPLPLAAVVVVRGALQRSDFELLDGPTWRALRRDGSVAQRELDRVVILQVGDGDALLDARVIGLARHARESRASSARSVDDDMLRDATLWACEAARRGVASPTSEGV